MDCISCALGLTLVNRPEYFLDESAKTQLGTVAQVKSFLHSPALHNK